MPRYLDTSGQPSVAIGICGRCKEKVPYSSLIPDPNYPGVLVARDHDGCLDVLDPWRLPPRATEDISLDHPRPDAKIVVGGTGVFANPLQATLDSDQGQELLSGPGGGLIAAAAAVNLQVETVWQPNTAYTVGAQVTLQNPRITLSPGRGGRLVNADAAIKGPFRLLVCIIPGMSGPTPPIPPSDVDGVVVEDNEIAWILSGILLP